MLHGLVEAGIFGLDQVTERAGAAGADFRIQQATVGAERFAAGSFVDFEHGDGLGVAGKADAAATEAGRVASDVAAANNLLQNTGDLGQLATDAKAKVDLLNSGAHQVASGASELQTGTKQAATGATDLANGLKQLQDGSVKLNDGLGQLASGADELATQLTAGVKRMPVLTPDEQADAVQVLLEQYLPPG